MIQVGPYTATKDNDGYRVQAKSEHSTSVFFFKEEKLAMEHFLRLITGASDKTTEELENFERKNK